MKVKKEKKPVTLPSPHKSIKLGKDKGNRFYFYHYGEDKLPFKYSRYTSSLICIRKTDGWSDFLSSLSEFVLLPISEIAEF